MTDQPGITVNSPYGTLHFPAGTSGAVIQRTMEHLAEENKAQGGLGSRIINHLFPSTPEGMRAAQESDPIYRYAKGRAQGAASALVGLGQTANDFGLPALGRVFENIPTVTGGRLVPPGTTDRIVNAIASSGPAQALKRFADEPTNVADQPALGGIQGFGKFQSQMDVPGAFIPTAPGVRGGIATGVVAGGTQETPTGSPAEHAEGGLGGGTVGGWLGHVGAREAAYNAAKRAREYAETLLGGTQASNESVRSINKAEAEHVAAQNAEIAKQNVEIDPAKAQARIEQAQREEKQRFDAEEAKREKAHETAEDARERESNRTLKAALDKANSQRKAGMDAVPEAMSKSYWQRIKDYIHMPGTPERSIPTDLGADTNLAVQRLVGGDLNNLRAQMRVDPGYAETAVKAIQKRVFQKLRTGAEKTAWNNLMDTDVLNPLGLAKRRGGRLTGKDLTDFITAIGNRSNELYKAARPSVPNGSYNQELLDQAHGLSDMVDQIEDIGLGDDPADPLHRPLSGYDKEYLKKLKRAYRWFSVGNNLMTVGSGYKMEPGQALKDFEKRAGGTGVALAKENLSDDDWEMVQWLKGQQTAHENPPHPPVDHPPFERAPFKRRDALPQTPTTVNVEPPLPTIAPPTPLAEEHLPIVPPEPARPGESLRTARSRLGSIGARGGAAGLASLIPIPGVPWYERFLIGQSLMQALDPYYLYRGSERLARVPGAIPRVGAATGQGVSAVNQLIGDLFGNQGQ